MKGRVVEMAVDIFNMRLSLSVLGNPRKKQRLRNFIISMDIRTNRILL